MMKGRRRHFLMLMVLLGIVLPAASAELYTPDVLIVKIAQSSSASALQAELSSSLPVLRKTGQAPVTFAPVFSHGPRGTRKVGASSDFPFESYVAVRCPTSAAADLVYATLTASSSVVFVQRNYIYHIDAVPNDSAYGSQWALQRIGVKALWEEGFFSTSRPAVTVGVLDTGIDYLHPDLAAAIAVNAGETGADGLGRDRRSNGADDDGNGFTDDWRGYNFVESETRGNDPIDVNGHGTGVAGIIGAVPGNGKGIAGIAPCRLLPLRAFDAGGNGSDADVAAAIVYGVDNGCGVINMSFGVSVLSPLMRDVVLYAVSNHVTLVASSGNDGNEKPHYPSDLAGVIAVGSVSQYDGRSYFSAFGASLALSAPGENIATTTVGGGYTSSFSGTSAAAPQVSGAAAIVKSVIAADPALNGMPFSPLEFRTLLASTADDVGTPGWEREIGAGIVNVHRAVNTIVRGVVTVSSPHSDAVLTGGPTAIRGTAVLPGMKALTVSVGAGERPDVWTRLSAYENRYFFGDTIAVWDPAGSPDGTYTLRLAAENIAGSDVESRVRVYLRRSLPAIVSFTVDDSVIAGDEYGVMVRVATDRPTTATLMLRLADRSGQFYGIQSAGIQKSHYFLLTSKDVREGVAYEAYCTAEDHAHQVAVYPGTPGAGAALPSFTVGSNRISTTGMSALPYSLPAGYVLDAVGSFGAKPTVLVNQYDEGNNFGPLKAYQYSNGVFTVIDSLSRQWVPRDVARVNGAVATLVQERGVTKIIGSDSASGKFFARDLFGDSTDVWGCDMYDIDGDGRPDMIARSSSEYLIYKNTGGNAFSLAGRLANPTPPLPGEANNQFGPPKVLVGTFSGSGKTEIVFADYDGDMLMYRASASDPFQFTLAWSDTTSLYETSEYLAAGDFDGDGTTDIAIAGHSNLGFNADREYDAPFWTVRIFSHPAGAAAGVMSNAWERKFAGVRSGFDNDNGVTTGRVTGTRDQLLLSLNPYFFIVAYDPSQRTYAPVWVHNGASNAAVVYDFNRNGAQDLGFNTGRMISFFEAGTAGQANQAPWAAEAEQTDETTVRLRWNSMTPAGAHLVYRDTAAAGAGVLSTAIGVTVSGTTYIDTAVTPGARYYYTVSSDGVSGGARSEAASIRIERRPRIISVEVVSAVQLRITLSAEADRSRLASSAVLVDQVLPAQSVISGSGYSLIATFAQAFSVGAHAVRLLRVFTYSGLGNDTLQAVSFAAAQASTATFGITEAKLVTSNTVRLRFNGRVRAASLRKDLFTVRTAAKSFDLAPPAADAADSTIVTLRTADGRALTNLGLRVEVVVSPQVTDRAGKALNDGKGQTLSFGVDVKTVAQAVVFPNPLRYLIGLQDKITFVNIPPRCRVSIFTAGGQKVIDQLDLSTADGLTWDLRDERGELVSSGIYLYRLVHLDDNGDTLESTLGKFAIIR